MSQHQGGVPPGFVVVPKGGRPPKTARDAAILLARGWRMQCIGETAKKADEWIVDSFKLHGLTSARHVRTRIGIAEKTTFLHACTFAFNEGQVLTDSGMEQRVCTERVLTVEWLPVERLPMQFDREHCSVLALGFGPWNRGKACIWSPGFKEARLAKLVPIGSVPQLAGPGAA